MFTTRLETYFKFGEEVVMHVSAPATTPSAGILQGYAIVLPYCFSKIVESAGSGLIPVALIWMAVPPFRLPAIGEVEESATVDIQSILIELQLKIISNNIK